MAAKKRRKARKRKKYYHLNSKIPGGIQVTPLKLVKTRNTTNADGEPATFYKFEAK